MKMRYCSDDALRTGKQIVNLNKNNTSENVASNENTIIIIIIELVLLRHNFSAVSSKYSSVLLASSTFLMVLYERKCSISSVIQVP